MKNLKGVSLKKFIKEVKDELADAARNPEGDPMFALTNVDLEVAVGLKAKGKAGFKFVVVDLGTEAAATQTHTVRLSFKPIVSNLDIIVKGLVNLGRSGPSGPTGGIGQGLALDIDWNQPDAAALLKQKFIAAGWDQGIIMGGEGEAVVGGV